jgi:Ca2+-binding RTX toxin-like protein
LRVTDDAIAKAGAMECIMRIESLERRCLLSVTVNQTSPGFYEINGDESDNAIVVSVSQDDQSFTLDGVTYTGVNYIYVFGNGGNDTIDVSAPSAGSIGASIDGGAGDDHLSLNFDGGIWGGDGDDQINLADSFQGQVSGDGGNDQIFVRGECVDANILGGDGNDLIDASENNYRVVISGGEGDDTLYGSQYNDQIYGDGGSNHIYGLGGNDTIYCRNGSLDDVDGGAGANFLYADSVEGQVTNICQVYSA